MQRTILTSSALALVLAAPAVFAQQSGGQEMDQSQHMMQSPPPAQAQQQPPGRQPGIGGPGRGGTMGGGKGGKGGGMGGMDHDMGGGGMGCGMMGSGGMGGGMGGGMMGGMGGGMMGGMGGGMMGGMGSGMMGGMGGGMGGRMNVPMGVTGPLSHLDLSTDQKKTILKAQDDLRKKHYEIKGKIMDEQVKLRDMHFADKRDRAAIVAEYRKLGELRGQMVESSLDAQDKIEAVLTKEQKDMLKQHHPMWMMDDM